MQAIERKQHSASATACIHLMLPQGSLTGVSRLTIFIPGIRYAMALSSPLKNSKNIRRAHQKDALLSLELGKVPCRKHLDHGLG